MVNLSEVADSEGPLLGCGNATFTAGSYRSIDRPLTLGDRSAVMCVRAGERLVGADMKRIALVHPGPRRVASLRWH